MEECSKLELETANIAGPRKNQIQDSTSARVPIKQSETIVDDLHCSAGCERADTLGSSAKAGNWVHVPIHSTDALKISFWNQECERCENIRFLIGKTTIFIWKFDLVLGVFKMWKDNFVFKKWDIWSFCQNYVAVRFSHLYFHKMIGSFLRVQKVFSKFLKVAFQIIADFQHSAGGSKQKSLLSFLETEPAMKEWVKARNVIYLFRKESGNYVGSGCLTKKTLSFLLSQTGCLWEILAGICQVVKDRSPANAYFVVAWKRSCWTINARKGQRFAKWTTGDQLDRAMRVIICCSDDTSELKIKQIPHFDFVRCEGLEC